MTFATSLALLIAALVALPLAAHLLRRGRARKVEFPPVRYVAATLPKARRRSSLQDTALFVLRVFGVLGLAILGATPFVRCSSLTLSRPDGASVALAIVLDDSLSMRARTGHGSPRWALAVEGARQLLGQLRPGDVVSIVLAGSPARVALAPTRHHASARRVVDALEPSDRGTDLGTAIDLARSTLRQQPQRDKRLIVLSDLAGDPLAVGSPPAEAPLESIRTAFSDCAVLSATTIAESVVVDVACTSPEVASARAVELFVTDGADTRAERNAPAPGTKLGTMPLARTQGAQRVEFVAPAATQARLRAVLTGKDDIPEDDAAAVAPLGQLRRVGVIAELETSRSATGGPSILEQALTALSEDTAPQPLAEVPGDYRDLARFSTLLIDDPPGFPPEAREALLRWLDAGGVAVLFLGPASARPSLGWSLSPILEAPVHWNDTGAPDLALGSAAWLGSEASTFSRLAARGRAQLSEAIGGGTQTKARWEDGEAWIVERSLGKGVGMAVGLPVNPEVSDFALRPGFLALLDDILQEGARRTFSGHSVVGHPWQFTRGSVLRITGPMGEMPMTSNGSSVTAEPTLAGRYEVISKSGVEIRYTMIEPGELARQPLEPAGAGNGAARNPRREYRDVSRYVALALLALITAELLLRARSRWRAAQSL